MTRFFDEYDPLAKSAYFDPEVFLGSLPDLGESELQGPVIEQDAPSSAVAPLEEIERPLADATPQVAAVDTRPVPAPSQPPMEARDLTRSMGPWSLRRKMSQAEVSAKLDQLTRLDWHPAFQIVLPIDADISYGSPAWRTLNSLSRQAYPDWRLHLVSRECGDSSMQMSPVPHHLMEGFGDIAERITLRRKGSRETIAFGLGDTRPNPSAELVLVLRAGDELGCDALLEFALASARAREAGFIYSDDRRPTPVEEKIDAFFKPGWSPDLLLGWNYIGRSWCASQSLFRKAGLNPRSLIDCNDHDLVLRLTEVASAVVHVPKVLSELGLEWSKGVVSEIEAVERAMKRRGVAGDVLLGRWPGQYRIKRELRKPGLVSIIIATDAMAGHIFTCIESLRRLTAYRNYEIICIENIPAERAECRGWLYKNADVVIQTAEPFRPSRYHNIAALKAQGEYLLFLSDDIQVTGPDWLDALLEHAQRHDVGVVGAQLLYPDSKVRHAGIVLDSDGRARQAFRHLACDDPGYFGLALSERNVMAVSGACQLVRRAVFDQLSGYDESSNLVNEDVDFCLRARDAGLLSIYTPHASLVQLEKSDHADTGATANRDKPDERGSRHIAAGDPYLNPNLSSQQESFTIERRPVEIVYAAQPLMAREAVRRILVIKLDEPPDTVAALPAVRKLKERFPRARISVLAGCSTYSIWKMEPAVDEILEYNFFDERSARGGQAATGDDLVNLKAQLGGRRFDLAIDLRRQPDTREVLRATGAHWLAGYDRDGSFPWLHIALQRSTDGSPRNLSSQARDELLALVDEISAAATGGLVPVKVPEVQFGLPKGLQRALFTKPLICIHPGAGSAARQWPLSTFSRLIDRLLMEEAVNVAVIGNAEERQQLEPLLNRDDSLTEAKGRLFDLVGKIGENELPTLLSRAASFIGNDCVQEGVVGRLGMSAPVYVPELWTLKTP